MPARGARRRWDARACAAHARCSRGSSLARRCWSCTKPCVSRASPASARAGSPCRRARCACREAAMDERTALVTGAGSGLGAAIARRLVGAGLRVVLCDLVADRVREVAEHIDPHGTQTLALSLDVADQSGVEAALAASVEHFGGLDVLVNNAGIDVTAPIDELDIAAWTRVLD